MFQLLSILNNDTIKKIGAVLGLVAAGVMQTVPDHTVAYKVAAALLAILSPLGLVSGGTKGAQPQQSAGAPRVAFAPDTGNAQNDAG